MTTEETTDLVALEKAKRRDEAAKKPLTDKEKVFAEQYCATLDPVMALCRAGYPTTHAAQRAEKILRRPNVKRFVKRLSSIISKHVRIEAYQVLKELREIAFSDITAITVDEKTGHVSVPVDRPDLTRAIASIDHKTTQRGQTVTHEVKIRMHPKMEALDKLGKHLQMWTEHEDRSGEPPILIIKGVDPDAALGRKQVEIEVLPPPEVGGEPIKLLVDQSRDGTYATGPAPEEAT